jgi:hypothetical protein
MRDFEHPLPDKVGLSKKAGVPSINWCWGSGLVVIAAQLGWSDSISRDDQNAFDIHVIPFCVALVFWYME